MHVTTQLSYIYLLSQEKKKKEGFILKGNVALTDLVLETQFLLNTKQLESDAPPL